jgi:hypothetical protein
MQIALELRRIETIIGRLHSCHLAMGTDGA